MQSNEEVISEMTHVHGQMPFSILKVYFSEIVSRSWSNALPLTMWLNIPKNIIFFYKIIFDKFVLVPFQE